MRRFALWTAGAVALIAAGLCLLVFFVTIAADAAPGVQPDRSIGIPFLGASLALLALAVWLVRKVGDVAGKEQPFRQ